MSNSNLPERLCAANEGLGVLALNLTNGVLAEEAVKVDQQVTGAGAMDEFLCAIEEAALEKANGETKC